MSMWPHTTPQRDKKLLSDIWVKRGKWEYKLSFSHEKWHKENPHRINRLKRREAYL